MRLIQRLSSPRIVAVSVALCAAFIAVAVWGLERSLAHASGSAQRVADTTKALIASTQFRASVADMVAAEQSLTLSRDPSFAAERDHARREAEAALAQLAQFGTGAPELAKRVARMAAIFEAGLTAMSPSAGLPLGTPSGGFVDPRLRELAAQTAAAALEIVEAERTKLARQRSAYEQGQRNELIAVALAFTAVAVLTLMVCTALYLESRHRRRSEEQLAEIVENLPLTVWQRQGRPGPGQKFLYVSSRSLQERGLEPGLLLTRPEAALDNILPEDYEAFAHARDAAGRTLTLNHTYRVLVRGTVRWIKTGARGHPTGVDGIRWTGYWVDVTEQKEMERRLHEAVDAARQANEAKSAFLAVMSHEIRTPLNGMLGLMELLAMTKLDADQRAKLDVAREAGHSLSQLIDDGLDLSRVEAARLELHPVPASLEAVVQRACRLHHAVALRQGLQLEWSVDPRLSPTLIFDSVRVGQILSNFLANAMKFTLRGSVRVTAELVSSEQDRQRIRLSVTDTGIGIAPEQLANIFEPFFQAGTGTYSRYGGSGLGLAICRELARAMGGEVRMRSTEGAGSEAVLEAVFPVAPAQPQVDPPAALAKPPAARPAPSVARAEAQGTLVLVADDHPTNREVLLGQLAALGYAAIGAADGIEALELWSTRTIGLLLCDCNMPGMDGLELTRAIRAHERTGLRPRLPILACTAKASAKDRQQCLDAGMDACLVKPIGLAGLAPQLARWLPRLAGAAAADAVQDGELGAAVLAEFAACHHEDLEKLAQAVAVHDCARVRLLAHRMAGAAVMIGAETLAESCFAVEDAARVGHAPTMEVELEELREQSAAFIHSQPAGAAPTPRARPPEG